MSEYRRKAKRDIVIGLLVQAAGAVPLSLVPQIDLEPIPSITILVGVAIFCWGCTRYARAKGYSPWIGLLCVFSLLGLLVLVLLPDRLEQAPLPSGTSG